MSLLQAGETDIAPRAGEGMSAEPPETAAAEAAPRAPKRTLAARFYPEIGIAGFSHVDGTIQFLSQVSALLRPSDRVLDFGAGRGETVADDPVPYRRALSDLQGRCAHLEGCDVDPVVLDNPHLDGARQIEIGAPLPYPDESFDLIVSRWVFEHVDQPQQVADELLRVLRPGGWICALTPNAWGYLAFASRMVPNRLHVRVLRYVQPGRKPEDVFPTRYRMNSMRALKRLFGGRAEIFLTRTSAEPAYHFDNWLVFAFFKLLHKLLPAVSQTTLNIFIRKAGAR